MAGPVVVSDVPMSESKLLRAGVLDGASIDFIERDVHPGVLFSVTISVMCRRLNPWSDAKSLRVCRNMVEFT